MKMLPTVLAWMAVGLATSCRIAEGRAESNSSHPRAQGGTRVHFGGTCPENRGRYDSARRNHPDGTAVNIEVLRSLNPGLDAKAVRAVQQWRFRPAKKDGESVSMAATIDVEFRLPRYPVLPSSSPRPDVSPLYDDDPWDLFRAIYYGWLLIPPSPAR